MSVLDIESIPEFFLKPVADEKQLVFEDDVVHLVGFLIITLVPQHGAVCMHPLVQLALRKWLEWNCQLWRWKPEAV